jgi:hypothetical protein
MTEDHRTGRRKVYCIGVKIAVNMRLRVTNIVCRYVHLVVVKEMEPVVGTTIATRMWLEMTAKTKYVLNVGSQERNRMGRID